MTTTRRAGTDTRRAKRSGPSREIPPWQPLAVFLALLAVVYGLIFFTGAKTLEPKLGIDLQLSLIHI